MKFLILVTLLSFSPILVSCQEKKDIVSTTENISNTHETIIEKSLKKQLLQGSTYTIDEAGGGLPKVQFEPDELEATASVINQLLDSNGYSTLNAEKFNKKIRDIFGRIIDVNSQSVFLYVNFFDKCNRELVMYNNNEIDYEGTFIDKRRKIITDLYYIPELIYYQKEFPKLNDIENKKIIRKSSIDDRDVEIPHWKDIPNLKEIRKKNNQTVVARNMYLFNDSKAHYKWLILNDQYFMENLVKTFGYTQDTDLLKWVIERTKFNKDNPQDYGKLFWTKDCDGKLRIHANTFKILQTLYTPENEAARTNDHRFILNNIKNYLEYLGSAKESANEQLKIVEKVKIMANLVYFAEQYKFDKRFVAGYGDNSMMMGRLRFFSYEFEGEKILKENNYFNLPKFKEWWDMADYDEYIVTGQYDGEWGTGYHPLSVSEWRKQRNRK